MTKPTETVSNSTNGIKPGDAQNAFVKKALKHLEEGNTVAAKVALNNALAFSKLSLPR